MPSEQRKQKPIRQSVHVDCPIDEAFRLFTEDFGQWWPLALYSMTGAEAARCELEPWRDGRIFERTGSGEEHDWGTVLTWNPPEHVHLSWHPAGRDDSRQTVDVEFTVEAQGTRVTVIHTGWETSGIGVCSLTHHFAAFVSEQLLVLA